MKFVVLVFVVLSGCTLQQGHRPQPPSDALYRSANVRLSQCDLAGADRLYQLAAQRAPGSYWGVLATLRRHTGLRRYTKAARVGALSATPLPPLEWSEARRCFEAERGLGERP